MNVFEGFAKGITAYGKAFTLLFSSRFCLFLIFPVVVPVLLFVGGAWITGYVGDGLSGWVESHVTDWVADISWLGWLSSAMAFVVRILVRIAYFFLFMSFGGYVVLIVMSPVYSWLSERTETALTGQKYPFSVRRWLWEMCRGIAIVVRNMIFQLLVTVLLLLCSFIPFVGLLTPIALFLTSSYFYGFSFVDYTVQRKRLGVGASVRYVNRNIGLVTGVGFLFALSLMVPFFRIFACSFVSLLSVMAGAVAVGGNRG